MHQFQLNWLVGFASLLKSTSAAQNAASEVPTVDRMFDPYENRTRPADPLEAWNMDGDCLPTYFSHTHDNVRNSKVAEWYSEYIPEMRKRYPEQDELGEVSFFTEMGWGDSDWTCNNREQGCRSVPPCATVVSYVMKHRKGLKYTDRQNLEEARRIFLMASEMNSISQYISYEMRLLEGVKLNVMSHVDSLIEEFTQQPDTEADKMCKSSYTSFASPELDNLSSDNVKPSILLLAYSTVLDIAKAGLMSFADIPQHLTDIVMYTETAVEMAINSAAQMDKSVSFSVGGTNFGPEPQESDKSKTALRNKERYARISQLLLPARPVAMVAGKTILEEISKAPSEHTGDRAVWNAMAPTAATGFCSRFGGGMSNENLKRSNKLKDYISDSFPQIVRGIEVAWEEAVHWKSSNESSWSFWVNNHDNSIHSPQPHWEDDLEKATQLYLYSLVSIAWRSGRCYQKCLCAPGLNRTEFELKQAKTHHKMHATKYQYHPNDEHNCVCQPACWHSARHNPFEKRLFGLDKLQKYNRSFTDIARISYSYYRANGNTYKAPKMTLWANLSDAEAGISLPHCVSPQLIMGDFDDESRNHDLNLVRDRNRRFPCTCGNWQSNETKPFMHIYNMAQGEGWMTSHAGDSLYKHVCPYNLKLLLPLNNYLAYCELGIRYPKRGEIAEIQTNQTDEHCDEIKNYYSTWLDNEREANKHFCKDNPIAKKIFKKAHIFPTIDIGRARFEHNLEHKCHAWLRKQEGKHHEPIVVPKELIEISRNGVLLDNANRTEGNGRFQTITLDDGPVLTTVVLEESKEQVMVDNYEPEASETEMPTASISQATREATLSMEQSVEKVTVESYGPEATETEMPVITNTQAAAETTMPTEADSFGRKYLSGEEVR